MWTPHTEQIAGEGLRVEFGFGAARLTYADVVNLWRSDVQFCRFFTSLLAGSSFSAFRWETPPITTSTITRTFEFVLIDDPDLSRRSDPTAFAEHFVGQPAGGVVHFSNLGRTATMIVPCPSQPASAYGHLGAFVRNAPQAQRDALWPTIAQALDRRLDSKPVWLSTAGAGVSWLHVRLDDRPKYYRHAAYRMAA